MGRILSNLALGFLACTLAGASANAQPAPQGGASGRGAQQQDLPQLLHLQPAQMGAFNALQGASRPTPDEVTRLRAASPQALAPLTTPQRLDRIAGYLATQQEMFQRSADATRAFYGQLTPDQKQSFDRLSGPPAGGANSGGQ